jgi:hypothetical protein
MLAPGLKILSESKNTEERAVDSTINGSELPELVSNRREKAAEGHSTASGQDPNLTPAMAALMAASAAIRGVDRLIRRNRLLVNNRPRSRGHNRHGHHLATFRTTRRTATLRVASLFAMSCFRDGRHDTNGDCAENEREDQ